MAGDDRGDDAAVEPAAREAVCARIGAGAAAAAGDGGVPRRLRARMERVRAGRVRRGLRSARRHQFELVAGTTRLVDRRLRSGPGGRVPVHIAQGRVPRQVPTPRPVPDALLRARSGRRHAPGHATRRVLRRLLLGPDARDVRRRRGEPDLDGAAHRSDDPREDAPSRRPRRTGHRRGAAGGRIGRARLLRSRRSGRLMGSPGRLSLTYA